MAEKGKQVADKLAYAKVLISQADTMEAMEARSDVEDSYRAYLQAKERFLTARKGYRQVMVASIYQRGTLAETHMVTPHPPFVP